MITGIPDQPLYIGEKVVVQFLISVDGNGVFSFFSPTPTAVVIQEMPIPSQLEQSDSFVYNLTFYAASILNSSSIQVTVERQAEGEDITNPSFLTYILMYIDF